MVMVQRGNVVLNIEDDDLGYYMGNGYDLIDARGNIIQSAVPRDVATLERFYREHTQRIADLEQQIADLKAELAKRATKSAKKSSNEAE